MRAIYTTNTGVAGKIWNLIETIGVFVQGNAHVDICCEPCSSYFNGTKAGNDPWDAWTLFFFLNGP